jgi:mannan endo-1,4-beta-mannosidase
MKKILLLAGIIFSQLAASAQKYEAESAVLAGGATKQTCGTCSGGNMVAQQEGNLTFTVNLATAGNFNVYVVAAAPNGQKTNTLDVNGSTADFTLVNDPAYKRVKVAIGQYFNAGNNTVKILKSWGWINIDYIELEAYNPGNRFNLNTSLVNPAASPEAKCLYQFLLKNYGQKIISGVMTLNSMDEVNWLKTNTGKEPALVGIDIMHTNRKYTWFNEMEPVNDAINYYGRNGIPIITWHWRDPSRATEEFYTNKTSFDVSKISDPNSAEYKAMISDIDYTANLFKNLKNRNVPILWRPLHEAGGGWFWWGAKGGAACKKLWQVMYDRMVNYHQLNNLIWVWTKEPADDAFYPGDEYVDIIGRDWYKTGDHSSVSNEFNNINEAFGGKKMVTLSECGSFPDVDNLIKDQAAWSWYMPWYGEYTRNSTYNSLDLWKKMFASPYVITLDEMPVIKTCDVITGEVAPVENSADNVIVYPTIVTDKVNLNSEKIISSVNVFNIAGEQVVSERYNSTEAVLDLSGLRDGVYFIRINESKVVKIVKD